jgi:hypothetical protein
MTLGDGRTEAVSMLLEDLAEEASASNRRAADRLEAEARHLDALRQAGPAQQERREEVLESAWQAVLHSMSRLPPAEKFWQWTLAELRRERANAETLLGHQLIMFEMGLRVMRSSREIWALALELGATPQPLDELDQTERRFEELAAEARRALEHRRLGWKPTDPDRFARGLQEAREGSAVSSAAARGWFRKTRS